MVLSSTMPPFHACERNWLTSIILVATWQDPQIMVYCNLYIYIYIIYICVCMWYFIPNPHHKQLKERAPLPTLSGFSSQKVRIHPHSTSHHFLDLNATPKETHVFCCYPRIKWSLNTPTTVISGGDDRMTSGCSPTACLGNMFFSFFGATKETSQTRCINQS